MSRTSSYESIIIKLLNKDKIPFEKEKQFRDLRNGLYKVRLISHRANLLLKFKVSNISSSQNSFLRKEKIF